MIPKLLSRAVPYVGAISTLIAAIISQLPNQNEATIDALIVAGTVSVISLWILFITFTDRVERIGQRIDFLEPSISSSLSSNLTESFEALGLSGKGHIISSAYEWAVQGDIYEELEENSIDHLIVKYAEAGEAEVGTRERHKIDTPIDFMSASSSAEDSEELARVLCCMIVQRFADLSRPFAFSKLATPVIGNIPIMSRVAARLNKGLLLVSAERALIGDDCIFGSYASGEKVLYVHDVIYTGARVADTIDVLRRSDLEVSHVAALVERTDREPRAAATLQRGRVELFTHRQLNSQELNRMITL